MTVGRRFRGPATSGNGGYTAGLLASHLPGRTPADVVRVRLRTPPPLETPLLLETRQATAVAKHGEIVVAEADIEDRTLEPVPPVDLETAVAAALTYPGLRAHPFPGCVVCGPDREPGDGMRLFPGLVAPGRTACPWQPDDSLASASGGIPAEIVWAALDCPGGWTAGLEGRPMVLGTISARVDEVPAVGEQCVVVGAARETSDRRAETATSLYGSDGRALAHAYAVWVTVDAEAFNRIFAVG